MTTIPGRIVIDFEFECGTEESGLLDGVLADLGAVIGQNSNGDDISSWDARIEDPRKSFDVVVTGNPVDGIRLHGPVPADLEDINNGPGDFHREEWWSATVEPYPNDQWEPLMDDPPSPGEPRPTRSATDVQVLDRLAYLLSAEEWPGASGMEDVAELVALTGRDITDNPEVDWPRH